MKFKILYEKSNILDKFDEKNYIENFKIRINTIENLKYIEIGKIKNFNPENFPDEIVMQKKIKQILAYRVILDPSNTYYKNFNIYAEICSKNKKTYNFYFSDVGYKIFNDCMIFSKFIEKFTHLSFLTIKSFIEEYEEENKKSGIIGNVSYLKPGIYPKSL